MALIGLLAEQAAKADSENTADSPQTRLKMAARSLVGKLPIFGEPVGGEFAFVLSAIAQKNSPGRNSGRAMCPLGFTHAPGTRGRATFDIMLL